MGQAEDVFLQHIRLSFVDELLMEALAHAIPTDGFIRISQFIDLWDCRASGESPRFLACHFSPFFFLCCVCHAQASMPYSYLVSMSTFLQNENENSHFSHFILRLRFRPAIYCTSSIGVCVCVYVFGKLAGKYCVSLHFKLRVNPGNCERWRSIHPCGASWENCDGKSLESCARTFRESQRTYGSLSQADWVWLGGFFHSLFLRPLRVIVADWRAHAAHVVVGAGIEWNTFSFINILNFIKVHSFRLAGARANGKVFHEGEAIVACVCVCVPCASSFFVFFGYVPSSFPFSYKKLIISSRWNCFAGQRTKILKCWSTHTNFYGATLYAPMAEDDGRGLKILHLICNCSGTFSCLLKLLCIAAVTPSHWKCPLKWTTTTDCKRQPIIIIMFIFSVYCRMCGVYAGCGSICTKGFHLMSFLLNFWEFPNKNRTINNSIN